MLSFVLVLLWRKGWVLSRWWYCQVSVARARVRVCACGYAWLLYSYLDGQMLSVCLSVDDLDQWHSLGLQV